MGEPQGKAVVSLRQGASQDRRGRRSTFAPNPIYQFGPCGTIAKTSTTIITVQDPASQRLAWSRPPQTVLVIKKVRDAGVIQPFLTLCKWLIEVKQLKVYVERAAITDSLLTSHPEFAAIRDQLTSFCEQTDDLTGKVDLTICLGGDGTLLYASSLFQTSVPPIMSFGLGSLGFLTPFQFDDFQPKVTEVLEGQVPLTLRSRLRCILAREEEGSTTSTTTTTTTTPSPPAGRLPGHMVMNDVVIDRGPSPYLCNLDLYLNGVLITSVQGDGLILSTPTGSTAYAAAAGASMVHPSVPTIMVTPICPHSLSFRPFSVPAGVELKVVVSPEARNSAWVSYDGRSREELGQGTCLRVLYCVYPIPSICAKDPISDWFDSLASCLHWNVRKQQQPLLKET